MTTRQIIQVELARRTLWDYAKLKAPDFYKDDREYLYTFCNELQDFMESQDEILLINAPPRHGKSRTSGLFVQWAIGENPKLKIITGSYNETLSTTFSKTVRNAIMEKKADESRLVFSDVFPGIEVKHGDAAANLWGLEGNETNTYLATSPSGTMTGFGADVILIDDLIKSEQEARTEHVLDEHYNWYANTMISRLEGMRKLILVMTRWSTGDLCGRVIRDCKNNGVPYRLVSFKAWDGRKMLCDSVLSRPQYERLMQTMNKDIVLANYDQEPIDAKGILYTELQTYDTAPEFSGVYSYTDTADEGADYLCSIIYGVGMQDGLAYVLDVVYTQDGMEVTEPLVAERHTTFRVNRAKIESNNGGRGFARNVKRIACEQCGNDITVFSWFHQSKNKTARILTGSTGVMNNVLFPSDWFRRWPEFYRDITRFQRTGKNAHDDGPDALTGVYEYMPKKSHGTYKSVLGVY